MSNQDGGPAFPHINECVEPDTYKPITSGGMTLRDYFAAKAMAGMVTGTDEWLEDAVAKCAYKLADAMVAERGGE